MYIVTIHNGGASIPIHNSKEKLTSGKITKGINTIDSFQFSMLPSSAGFKEIHDYTTLVKVYNTNRNRYEFYGRVLYSEDTMSESGAIKKEAICESYLGFLCDSQQNYVEERNWTVGGLLQHVVNTHNSQVESYKQFTIGEVTVTDPNDNLYCGIQRENTWETLKKKLVDVLGGEFRFRVVGDVIYLDYLVEIGEKSSTEITLSRNMKSISREKDPSEIVTRLIPLGYKLKATDSEGKEVETEYRLDITSVNNGKKYIDDETAISIYGIRVATVEFDDVTVASTLLKKGEAWLIENNKIAVSYTITALDLSLNGLDADDFEVCNYHVVKNPLLGIDDTIRIIKKNIDICDEVKSTLEFGDNFETLSASMKRHSDTLGLITSNFVTNQKFENIIEKTSTLIEQTEEQIRLETKGYYDNLSKTVMAELALKVGKDENDRIISMINASANVITLNSNRLIINSDKFSLAADGSVTITDGDFAWRRREDSATYGHYTNCGANIGEAGISYEKYSYEGAAVGTYGKTGRWSSFGVSEDGVMSFHHKYATTFNGYENNATVGMIVYKQTYDDQQANPFTDWEYKDAVVFAIDSTKIQLGGGESGESDTIGACRGKWYCEPIMPNGTLTYWDDVAKEYRQYDVQRNDSRILTLWDLYNLGLITEEKYREVWNDDSHIR